MADTQTIRFKSEADAEKAKAIIAQHDPDATFSGQMYEAGELPLARDDWGNPEERYVLNVTTALSRERIEQLVFPAVGWMI